MGITRTAEQLSDHYNKLLLEVANKAKKAELSSGQNIGDIRVWEDSGIWYVTMEGDSGGMHLSLADQISADHPATVLAMDYVEGVYMWGADMYIKPYGRLTIKF